MLLNTGDARPRSRHRLLTTIAYQWDGKRTYALEGSIFSAGSTVQWLRDSLGIINTAAESTRLAAEADDDQPVYLVPAFTGLGAPHWRSDARATLSGLTRGTTRREIARAALESVGYQTLGPLEAMRADMLDAGSRARGGHPGGWRDVRQRLDHAIHRRRARQSRGPPGRAGDHGALGAAFFSPDGARAFTAGRRTLPATGTSTGASRLRWRTTGGPAKSRVGATRSRRRCTLRTDFRPAQKTGVPVDRL